MGKGLETWERYLDRDTFTVRRPILTTTTPRNSKHHTHLPKIFEGAHPWPLQWGGPEVREAHWFAHDVVNNGFQNRLERAGRRFAERLKGTDYQLYATTVATCYPERSLLKEYIVRFEAVDKAGNVTPLGEVSVEQSLTLAQRRALVEGEVVQGQHGGRMVIRHGGKTVTIDPDPVSKRMVVIPNPEMFGDVGYRVNELARGFQRKSGEAKSKPAAKPAAPPRPAPAAVNAAPAPNPPASTVPTSRTGVEGRALGNTTAAAANRGSTAATPAPTQTTGSTPVTVQPSKPAPAQPALNPSSVKIEVTAPLANALARQQALAGGAMELYSRQLANMRAAASADAEAAVLQLQPAVDRLREQGQWVMVFVTFAVPITQDVFGLETDSYPIFWGAHYTFAQPITETPSGPTSPDFQARMLMQHLRATRANYDVQKNRGSPRKVPPGRKLVSEEYRLYSPFPKLPPGSGADNWRDPLRGMKEVYAPDKERWLGTGRCTR